MVFIRTGLLGLAALTLAACGGHGGHDAGKAAEPATIEQLAAKTGCTLTGKRAAEELQQGACQTAKGRYTLVGFATDRGQQAWLEEAKPWGGTYLVGARWVAVGTPQTMESLRGTLGGTVLNGARHHS